MRRILLGLVTSLAFISAVDFVSAQNRPSASTPAVSVEEAINKGREANGRQDHAAAEMWFSKAADQARKAAEQ